MNSNWKFVPAKEIINFNPKESIAKNSNAKKISMDKIEPYTKEISNFEVSEFKGGTKFRNGDTLMARITPCLENGKTAQVNILEKGEIGFGSTEFMVLREKKNISDKDFIYYLSISDIFRKPAIKSMVGTSGRQRVQKNILENLQLWVPPLEEQKEIGRILSRFDKKIEINNQINKNLEEILKSLYKNWFIDLKHFENEKIKDTKLGKMLSDWEIKELKEFAKDIVCGKTPSTKKPENYGDNFPFITIPDMHNQLFIISTERYLSKEGSNSQIKKLLPKNSVCVSCIATVGLVSLTTEESHSNQQINTIICENESHYYLYLKMLTLSNILKCWGSSGSTTLNLNTGQFAKIKIIIPTEKVIKEFTEIVKPFFNKIMENQKEIEKLSNLRDVLLPKLMSGEINVSKVEI